MAIVSSSVISDDIQVDGRHRVYESHIDSNAIAHIRTYLGASNVNTATELAAYAILLAIMLQSAEIDTNITQISQFGSLASPSFLQSTIAQNAAALRAAYATATQYQAIMIADFLSTKTDAQLQAAFSLTAGQVTTLRTNKLTPAAAEAASIRATIGS